MKNKNLTRAKIVKNDEFYTCLEDIEKEMHYYKSQFKDKVIYLNCDKVGKSQFWEYFHLNFAELGLKQLIATWYDIGNNPTEIVIYNGGNDSDMTIGIRQPLLNGSFDSEECISLLKKADIVITNPPFSLFREYINLLLKYNKSFLIIGSKNAITYKDVFPLIQKNLLWLGVNEVKQFVQPNGEIKKFGNICWFTNLNNQKRNQQLVLYKEYNEEEYPKYDNYDIINVNKVADIPLDYKGIMGVPITFLDKYNPKQFKILGIANSARWIGLECFTLINNKKIYNRILIQSQGDNNECQ